MRLLGIIGGSGLACLEGLKVIRRESLTTDFGEPSADLTFGRYCGQDVVFLARHSDQHSIPPHKINYRANIWAIKTVGVDHIVAVAAVGGISDGLRPGRIVIPDQVIDYTYGRINTFFEDEPGRVSHVDFTCPYSESIRNRLLRAAEQAGMDVVCAGTYGCTQGPRLETAAEIVRMERDGCAIVGMTGMPEAILAREADMEYACCAVVANSAAGKTESEISLVEIERNLEKGILDVTRILKEFVSL